MTLLHPLTRSIRPPYGDLLNSPPVRAVRSILYMELHVMYWPLREKDDAVNDVMWHTLTPIRESP